MADESWFWRWAGRVATHAPWIAKAWPYVLLVLTGPVTAALAALKHLDLWQVWLIGWVGVLVGLGIITFARLAYVKWSPWGKMARGEIALHRRQLIAAWRAMITEVNRTHQTNNSAGFKAEVQRLLEGHPAFPSLRPYLSGETRLAISGVRLIASESSLPGELDATLMEIDRLEAEWKLRP